MPDSSILSAFRRFQIPAVKLCSLAIALPLLFYCLPLFFGYEWNLSSGPKIVNSQPGVASRIPGQPITAEPWGAAVVVIPFESRLERYIRQAKLPLWNPYQGLGQPFAAQGDGSPYSPLTIVRALAESKYGNIISFLVFAIASVFIFLFLRELGVSKEASAFGAAALCLAPLFSFHIPRYNIADQYAFIPILFWASLRAIRSKTVLGHVVLALATSLTLIAGFIQTAVLIVVVCTIFGLFYLNWDANSRRDYLVRGILYVGFVGIGTGLAAPFLFPIIEIINVGFHKNTLVFYNPPIPIYNLSAFFFPSLIGNPLDRPIGINPLSNSAWPVDWANLFASAGIVVLTLCLIGAFASRWRVRLNGRLFLFFLVAGLVLLLRYLDFPPFSLINALPILGHQTPKHANALSAFLLICGAVIALDNRNEWKPRQVRFICLGVVLYALAICGSALNEYSVLFPDQRRINGAIEIPALILTALIGLTFWMLTVTSRASCGHDKLLIAAMVIAEFTFYIPLGIITEDYSYLRLVTVAALILGAYALTRHKFVLGALAVTVSIVTYCWVVVAPDIGLPKQANVRQAPLFASFLQAAAGNQYRSFGVFPDFSSVIAVQDIGVVGPFATGEFAAFVNLVDNSKAQEFYGSSEFMLAGRRNLPLKKYLEKKAVFDWLSVRYLVLEKAFFVSGERKDQRLLDSEPGKFRLAYEDNDVFIYESLEAQPRAIFSPSFSIARSQASIIRALQMDPTLIMGFPMLESSDFLPSQSAPTPSPATIAHIIESHPNSVRLSVNANSPGLLILKDSYYPGWGAKLDGRSVEVLRVNGVVRGIYIDEPGVHLVEFEYRPISFLIGVGLLLALAGGLLLLGTVGRRLPPTSGLLRSVVLAGLGAVIIVTAFGFRNFSDRPRDRYYLTDEKAKASDLREGTISYRTEYPNRGGNLILVGNPIKLPIIQNKFSKVALGIGDLVYTAGGDLTEIGPRGNLIPVIGSEGQTLRLIRLGVSPGEYISTEVIRTTEGQWKVFSRPHD